MILFNVIWLASGYVLYAIVCNFAYAESKLGY